MRMMITRSIDRSKESFTKDCSNQNELRATRGCGHKRGVCENAEDRLYQRQVISFKTRGITNFCSQNNDYHVTESVVGAHITRHIISTTRGCRIECANRIVFVPTHNAFVHGRHWAVEAVQCSGGRWALDLCIAKEESEQMRTQIPTSLITCW